MNAHLASRPGRRRIAAWVAICCLAIAGCGEDPVTIIDAATIDAATVDGEVIDIDAAVIDAAVIDAAEIDAPAIDATEIDAPAIDAAEIDAAAVDAPAIDAAAIDAAAIDAAAIDAAAIDAAAIDAAAIDAGAIDASAIDASTIDASTIDASAIDAAAIDAALTTLSTWTAASGSTPDTLCVPWTLVDTSTPEGPVLAGGLLTLGNDADGEALYYLHPEAALAMPATLIIEARVRFGTGGSQTPSRSGAGISFAFGATDRKNTLFIDDGVVFLLSAENTRGASHAAPTTDAVHTYRVEVTVATSAIAVFRDGVPILTGAAFVSPYDVATAIYFGEASVVAHGTSSWESVSHNALAPAACP